MSEQTNIEWADSTFNPWMGCTKVSPACDHCYAERDTKRFGRVEWGAGKPRVRTSAANWRQPERWNREVIFQCGQCGVRWTHPDGKRGRSGWETNECSYCPACASSNIKSARRRVFCASLADWLDNEVPIEWLVDLLDLIRRTPNLDWLLLTKRIGNWQRRLDEAWTFARGDLRETRQIGAESFIAAWQHGNPPPNVWLGATVVNQGEADRDVPKLLAVPARVRFLSIEPMLEAVNLRHINARYPLMDVDYHHTAFDALHPKLPARLDWIICGGESGPHARPMHPDWVRSLRDQCAAAGVPFLFKQWGEWAPISQVPERAITATYRSNRKAREHEDQDAIDESYGRTCAVESTCIWMDGSTRPIIEPMAFLQGKGGMSCYRIGKKAAGRELDGRTHDGVPGGGA